VASAGTLISSVGKRRYCGKHAHMLIHQLSSAIYGTFTELQSGMDSATALMKILKEFYKKNTKIPMKKLDELMTKDIYLNSGECLSYGIVDEIK
jgi:ATP-dependent Clp protease protease subunit